MERKVGEIFTYKNKTYQIVPREKEDCCIGCAFDLGKYACKKPRNEARNNFGHCYFQFREDKKGIIFKEVNNIEIKNSMLTINIPKGMEIDTENSDLVNGVIKFKKKDITYDDIWSAIIAKDIYSEMNFSMINNKKLGAINKLINIARYYNGDWKPDWSNSKENKYCIKFDYHKDRFYVDYNNSIGAGDVFFKNSEDARAVINNPNFKSILNTIYKN